MSNSSPYLINRRPFVAKQNPNKPTQLSLDHIQEEAIQTINKAEDITKFVLLPTMPRDEDNLLCTLTKLPTQVDGLNVVIGLDAANEEEYRNLKQKIADLSLPQDVHLIWNDSPDNTEWRDDLAKTSDSDIALAPNEKGKGRNVHTMKGYVNAYLQEKGISSDKAIVAMCDTDVTTFNPLFVLRLLEPMCQKNDDGSYADFKFTKGHFFRFDDEKWNGRVTRLFVPAFIRALHKTIEDIPDHNANTRQFLEFCGNLEYILSGEVGYRVDAMNQLSNSSKYELETREISEIFQIISKNPELLQFTDSQLAEKYEHHHQDAAGIKTMATQIALEILTIVNKTIPITDDIIDQIIGDDGYSRRARIEAKASHFNAKAAQLTTDLDKELGTTTLFNEAILDAYEELKAGKAAKPIASWDTIMEIKPDAPAKLLANVQELGGFINGTPPLPTIEHPYSMAIDPSKTNAPQNLVNDFSEEILSSGFGVVPRIDYTTQAPASTAPKLKAVK